MHTAEMGANFNLLRLLWLIPLILLSLLFSQHAWPILFMWLYAVVLWYFAPPAESNRSIHELVLEDRILG